MPKMVNRGAVGTYKGKLISRRSGAYGTGKNVPGGRRPALPVKTDGKKITGKKDHIAPALVKLAVPISSLVPDPNNARLHPERNLEAIKESLALYGQVKPLVVRKSSRIIIAGNGTFAAAQALGWTKIAANFVDMTAMEAIGYGLADNRSAELARWDFEVVSRVERLMQEKNASVMIGWSDEEVQKLRAGELIESPADFPEVDESIEIEHTCPKCGYKFSGGQTAPKTDGEPEDDIPF